MEMEKTGLAPDQEPEDNQTDSFLSGWDEEDGAAGVEVEDNQADAEPTDNADGQPEEPPAEEPPAGEPPEAKTAPEGERDAQEEQPEPDQSAQQATTPVSWTVNHLGATKVVKAEDITPALLQKGMDYDRIREKYDEAKPILAMFSDYAQKANMSVADYVRSIRLAAKQAEGMTPEQAQKVIELEDREAAVRAAENEQREAAQVQEAGAAKVQKDIAAFAEAFPEVYAKAQTDPNAIPKEVWETVNGGKSLVAAYAAHVKEEADREVKAAQAREEANRLNAKNAARSTGPVNSAGGDTKSKDPFLEGWDS